MTMTCEALIEAQRKLIDDQAETIARLMQMNADLMRLVSHLEICTRIDPRLLGAEAPGGFAVTAVRRMN